MSGLRLRVLGFVFRVVGFGFRVYLALEDNLLPVFHALVDVHLENLFNKDLAFRD